MTDNLPDILKEEIDVTIGCYSIRTEPNLDEFEETLKKGKYDIDYSIGICKMVLGHCDHHKICTSANLALSLKHSLNKLIKFLESEKIPKNPNPMILFTCPRCRESEMILAKKEKQHICNFCNPNLPIGLDQKLIE